MSSARLINFCHETNDDAPRQAAGKSTRQACLVLTCSEDLLFVSIRNTGFVTG